VQLKFLDHHPLTKKIAIVTAIKLFGLLVIWWLFFAGSSDGNLTPDQVGNALLHSQHRNTTTR
jgi:hypothetical protein